MGRASWSLPGTKSTKVRKRFKNVCARLQKDFGGGPTDFNWSIHVGHQMTSLNIATSADFAIDNAAYRMLSVCVVLAMGQELATQSD